MIQIYKVHSKISRSKLKAQKNKPDKSEFHFQKTMNETEFYQPLVQLIYTIIKH